MKQLFIYLFIKKKTITVIPTTNYNLQAEIAYH